MSGKEPEHFDLIIIGGGPAGTSAAKSAAKLGLSVAIVDKARFPRDKLCGGMISGRSQRLLKSVFGLKPKGKHFLTSCKVSFKWQGEVLSAFDAPKPLVYTMRLDFDRLLFEAAGAAGTVAYEGSYIMDFDFQNNRIRIGNKNLQYKILIGADGVNSAVARALFGRAFDPDKIGFGLECEVPGTATEGAPVMQIDFRALPWGYGWDFPKSCGRSIGIGGVKSANPDMKRCMSEFLHQLDVDETDVQIRGQFLPFGDYRKQPGRGNVLLAGDAAGLVDPLTGEGIAYALESGVYAAQAASEVLGRQAPGRAELVYRKKLQPLHKELSKANRLRNLAFSDSFSEKFKNRLRTSETLCTAFFDLLDGNIGYGDLEKMITRKTLNSLKKSIFDIWPRL